MIAVRRDTGGALVPDGKNSPVQVDANGNLRVASDATAALIATAIAGDSGLTYHAPLAINGTGYITLNAAVASNYIRVHRIRVYPSVADTVILYSADDDAGTNKAELCRWTVAAYEPVIYEMRTKAAECFKTAAVNKYLLLYAASATLTGESLTSQATS